LLGQRRRFSADERFLVALGAFVWLHGPMIGWARGNNGPEPASRYFDVLALALLVNAMAGVSLVRQGWFRFARPLLAAWVLVAATGLTLLFRTTWREELPIIEVAGVLQSEHVRHYLASGDPKELVVPVAFELPFHTVETLRGWLDDPFIRSILPW